MRRNFIAALVGGIILFIWQFLSWTKLNLHQPAQKYTPKQDEVIQYLGSQLEEGGYMMPTIPPHASSEEMEATMKKMESKPWAQIYYHKSWDNNNMYLSMLKSFITNVITVLLLCIILSGFAMLRFANVFVASLFTGLIVFLNSHYTMHIWYSSFDIMAHFTDAIVSWGVCGLWLGWWFGRRTSRQLPVDSR